MTILTLPPCSSRLNTQKISKTTFKNDAHSGGIVTSAVSQKIGAMADSGALGKDTKSQSKTNSKENKNLSKSQANRRAAYALKKTSAKLLPAERVSYCLSQRIDADRGVGVRYNKTTGKAGYDNLQLCGSVWVCPCCSARILAKRGNEVEKGVETWTQAGGSVWMLTLTHSHQRTDNLAIKMKLLQKALSRFFGDRAMKSVFEQFGKVGQIKALETTYSEANGWHPHHHILMFSKMSPDEFLGDAVSVVRQKDGSLKYLTPFAENQIIKKAEKKAQKEFENQQKIFAELVDFVENEELFTGRDCANKQKLLADAPTKRGAVDDIETVNIEKFIKHFWQKICTDVGLGTPSLERGATMQNAGAVKTYLTKFKTAQELTNAQAKRAKGDSRNQWEILADAHTGCDRSAQLWQIYANAFKGQRQLFWSRGLKEMLLIDDIADDEIEELEGNKEDDFINIIELAVEDWGYIRKKNWEAQLLDIVEDDQKQDRDNLSIFIYSIKKLVECERVEREQKRRERIANLYPPQWFDDIPNIA